MIGGWDIAQNVVLQYTYRSPYHLILSKKDETILYFFFIWSWKSWNWWFWVVLKGSHTRHYVRNDVCRVFVSQEKKHFFMKKYFFRILHYSTALPESSPIMKIINFHEKPWFSLIFNDFHWFSLILVKNHENWWFSMLLDVPRIRY